MTKKVGKMVIDENIEEVVLDIVHDGEVDTEAPAHADGHAHTHGEENAQNEGHVHTHENSHVHTDGALHTHAHKHGGIEHTHEHAHSDSDGFGDTSSHHGHQHDPAIKKKQLNRLSRIIGHLEHIKRLIENDEDCSNVLMQISATKSALNGLGKSIINEHLTHCIVHAIEDGDMEEIEEFQRSIEKYI